MKKVFCIILALLMICSISVYPMSAESSKDKASFSNENELRATILEIFNDNYNEFVSIARTLREIPQEDKYITYYTNCGPCTTAFQKILYDNSIIAEAIKSNAMRDHIFNLVRIAFSESPDKVSNIIIDTTYKQYIAHYYTNIGLTFDDVAEDLPPIIVYEYGNRDDLETQLTGMKARLNEATYSQAVDAIYGAHYFYQYLPQDFQSLDDKAIMNYSAEFTDKLRNESGVCDLALDTTPVLSSIDGTYQKPFIYDGNGIYRCYFSFNEVSSFAGGFNIVDTDGKLLYGASAEYDSLKYLPTMAYYPSEYDVRLLKKDSEYPLSLNTQGLFLPILISIDLRAGKDTPAIYAYTVSRVLPYGDTDSNSQVDITDVTLLQRAIANFEGSALDIFELETANVLKTNPMDITNATEICRYLAKYDSEFCGQNIYCSATLKLSSTNQFGYIDMPIE